MAGKMKFTSNYDDLSTDKGYQFEFHCDRCGVSYRSKFKASATGVVSEVLDGAGSIFGGIFNSASNLGNRAHSATYERAREKALDEAADELKEEFIQCPRCSSWVCKEKCWNAKKGLCKTCAPDLGVEMSAAQANRSVEEIWAHAEMAEDDKHLGEENWKETIMASCPKCGSALSSNSKFCPECGAKISKVSFCPNCGAKIDDNNKFCPGCGKKLK